MKYANRSFLFALLLMLILVCGVGATRPGKTGGVSTTDCADQCKERYDTMLKRCNNLSGDAADRCQAAAQKQYDSCLERCKERP
jgi:hypothetical protein